MNKPLFRRSGSIQGISTLLPLVTLAVGVGASSIAVANEEIMKDLFRGSSCPAPILKYETEIETLLNRPAHGVLKTLEGHIPQAISQMLNLGKVDGGQPISVTLALKLNNEQDLDNMIGELYRPGSASFHKFLTSQEFEARYAPTAEQIATEKAFLEAHGITVQSVSDNQLFINAQGTASAINAAFSTEINQYKSADGKLYFAPAYDLQVPAESRISAVIGLNNYFHLRSNFKRKLGFTGMAGERPQQPQGEGSGPNGGLSPSDILNAYGIPRSLSGSGQTLALMEITGYKATDISGYESQFNLPNVPLQNVLVDGSTGSAAGEGAAEATMDIELMIAMAPQVSKIMVYEGPATSRGIVDLYSKIASDNVAKQVSTSIGQPESEAAPADIQSESTVFKQMISQGQVLYAASGDSGPDGDGKTVGVLDPSSQPYVVGVGGTTLKIGSGGSYQGETTWNELKDRQGAGGGGLSKFWGVPSFQSGAGRSDGQFSQSQRNVPDVALNSDPETGYAIFQGGKWGIAAGTSAAAPLWAAFTALVNQQRASSGRGPIGFTAPAIYTIGASQSYLNDFNDIADGSTNGMFKAGPGYDNATGWGTFRGSALLNDLSQD